MTWLALWVFFQSYSKVKGKVSISHPKPGPERLKQSNQKWNCSDIIFSKMIFENSLDFFLGYLEYFSTHKVTKKMCFFGPKGKIKTWLKAKALCRGHTFKYIKKPEMQKEQIYMESIKRRGGWGGESYWSSGMGAPIFMQLCMKWVTKMLHGAVKVF